MGSALKIAESESESNIEESDSDMDIRRREVKNNTLEQKICLWLSEIRLCDLQELSREYNSHEEYLSWSLLNIICESANGNI